MSVQLATRWPGRDEHTPSPPARQILEEDRVHIAGGRLLIAPNDWEAVGKMAPLAQEITTFELDRYEVTVAQWSTCTECPQLADVAPRRDLPVTHVNASNAEQFCRNRGGRLPTHAEWTFAASSVQGNRYPWGQTGLVCRKAVYGMVEGPCGEGATSPNPVGSRPLGVTASGLHDLCGNVAEWVTNGDTTYAVGGSFRSTLAGQLKVWSREEVATRRDDVGFRCAYDR